MGADLYLMSLFQKQRDEYEPKFDAWVRRRDALLKAGKLEEAGAAQEKVDAYFDKLYAQGYFRDSYNSSNLLWLFELSWWVDAGDLIDEGQLPPDGARRFLQLLAEREPVFEQNLSQVELSAEETREEVEHYFQTKYENLQAFLQAAIERDEPIVCSI